MFAELAALGEKIEISFRKRRLTEACFRAASR
jgi:hypothetical protein